MREARWARGRDGEWEEGGDREGLEIGETERLERGERDEKVGREGIDREAGEGRRGGRGEMVGEGDRGGKQRGGNGEVDVPSRMFSDSLSRVDCFHPGSPGEER